MVEDVMFKMVFAVAPAVAVTIIPNASAQPAGAAMGGVGWLQLWWGGCSTRQVDCSPHLLFAFSLKRGLLWATSQSMSPWVEDSARLCWYGLIIETWRMYAKVFPHIFGGRWYYRNGLGAGIRNLMPGSFRDMTSFKIGSWCSLDLSWWRNLLWSGPRISEGHGETPPFKLFVSNSIDDTPWGWRRNLEP